MKKTFYPLFLGLLGLLSGGSLFACPLSVSSREIMPGSLPSPGETAGSLYAEVNGKTRTYLTAHPFTSQRQRTWDVSLDYRGEKIIIALPSAIKSGAAFGMADMRVPVGSVVPPFSFALQERSGNRYILGDPLFDDFEAFWLSVDRWDGPGGFAEGRFTARIRPFARDPIRINNGRFKIKIGD